MNKYIFMLIFTLPDRGADPEFFLDALFEAGCDDASVGVAKRGMVGLDFTRRAEDAEDALRSAIRDVEQAIPGAVLVQAGPDLVGLSEMAEIFGFSRQNMRKYAMGQSVSREAFPAPAVTGESSLWHLAEIANWLKLNTIVQPSLEVVEVAKAAARVNLRVQQERVGRLLEKA